jgi:hypothetical protein
MPPARSTDGAVRPAHTENANHGVEAAARSHVAGSCAAARPEGAIELDGVMELIRVPARANAEKSPASSMTSEFPR